MPRWRLLLSRPWVLAAIGVLLAMAACILLGLWQLHRHEAKVERAERVDTNYSAAPVPLDSVLPAPDAPLPATDQWRTVEVTGSYDTRPEHVLYVRNRPYHGEVGFAQLVPFRTSHGTIMVARGWLPMAATGSRPQSPPPPPGGERTVVLHLRPTEPVLEDRTSPPGQIQSIAPAEFAPVAAGLGPLYVGAYGQLVSESPDPGQDLTPFERPDTSLGPHLSYAVQWWVFALFFPVAWVVRARTALRDQEREQPGGEDAPGRHSAGRDAPGEVEAVRPPWRGHAQVPRAVRRRSQDEEEEDALVDSSRP